MMVKEKLTQEMIDSGERCNAYKCPIAQFFKYEFPNEHCFADVEDDGSCSHVYVGERRVIFENDKKIADFITRFDNGKDVKPFFIEYELAEG